jgi:hypothetical protein
VWPQHETVTFARSEEDMRHTTTSGRHDTHLHRRRRVLDRRFLLNGRRDPQRSFVPPQHQGLYWMPVGRRTIKSMNRLTTDLVK